MGVLANGLIQLGVPSFWIEVANGVPYVLEGALGFYGRKEVRDLIAFLQLSVERDGDIANEAVKRIINVPSTKFVFVPATSITLFPNESALGETANAGGDTGS